MSLVVELAGAVTVYPSTAPKEKLSIAEISQTETFDEEMLVAGNLDAGSGWYSIPFGVITTAAMLDFKSNVLLNVKINGGTTIENVSRLILRGEITSLELERQADATPRYSAHFFE